MLQRFQHYCKAHNLYRPNNSRWLIAVSGGVDSMLLAHLCWSSGFEIGIAHCNFSLRGAESNLDEMFVKHWAQERKIPFYSITFDTKRYAAERGISTQMAARDLRYAWFEELRDSENYTDIVVAHHADDNAETLLINFTRGTGIKGLCGMQPVNGRVLRPLLFASRAEIAEYAAANSITYREDSTNEHNDYARNRIRHNVVPELQQINPAATKNMLQTASHLTSAYQVIADECEKLAGKICSRTSTDVRISITALTATPHYNFWLYELLQPYNFSGEVVADLLQSLDGQAGKRFYSATHELIKDRSDLIIISRNRATNGTEEFLIDEDCREILLPVSLDFEYKKVAGNFIIPKEKSVACLALDKLNFPLILRLWRDGDSFIPFGMKGVKKISDFLIDEKVALHEKAKQYVLQSGKDIVWVVGRRIDERYKLTGEAESVLIVRQK